MATIYALLVGINNYPGKPLRGCINDVRAVRNFLESRYPKEQLRLKILTDDEFDQPTRANFIAAFGHFKAAQPGDGCLLYYSGHGSFTSVMEGFKTDNGFMQSFVLKDSRSPGGRDLMNKEMSYLIAKALAGKPGLRFTAITDCCHAGSITKGLEDDILVTDRMMSPAAGNASLRPEDFLGFGELVDGMPTYEPVVSAEGTFYTVARGPHIHFAASQNSQTSKELLIEGIQRGAFTYSMLKTLQKFAGRIANRALSERAAALVKTLVTNQRPVIHFNGGLADAEGEKLFLSDIGEAGGLSYLVYYDVGFGWCINAGPMHDVLAGDKVVIGAMGETVVVRSPGPEFSVIQAIPGLDAPGQQFEAMVERKAERLIRVSWSGYPLAEEPTFREGVKDTFGGLIFTDEPGQYVIRANSNDESYLALPGSEVPIFKPLRIDSPASFAAFTRQAQAVVNWKRILAFSNVSSSGFERQYLIRLYRQSDPLTYAEDSFVEVTGKQELHDFFYYPAGDVLKWPAFRVSVTNLSQETLWVTSIVLGFDYGIVSSVFEPTEIASGTTYFLEGPTAGKSPSVIKLRIDPGFRTLGYNSITQYIQLYMATGGPKSTAGLEQQGVELAPKGDVMGFSADDEEETVTRWQTETIGFRLTDPSSGGKLVPGANDAGNGIVITAPAGFSSAVQLGSTELVPKSADVEQPPHLVNYNTQLSPFDLSGSARGGRMIDLLELHEVQGKELITESAPMVIGIAGMPPEPVLPLGYDAETGLYYPLGYSTAAGIVIETLPEESPALGFKSFSGSIKIYFQKVIGQKLGFVYAYPRLAIAQVDAALEVSYESGPDQVKAAVAAAEKILLFVHGIIGDTEGMVKCVRMTLDECGGSLLAQCDLVLAFDYENLNTSIENNAALLKAKLAEAGLPEGHGKQLILVAHSMGGLISRCFIEQLGGHKVVSSDAGYAK